MDQSNRLRAVFVVALVVVSILMLVPTYVGVGDKNASDVLPEWYTQVFSKKMVLGLDLQGGIHLQYKVDVEEALRRKATQVAGNIETTLKAERQVIAKATPMEGDEIDQITSVIVNFEKAEDTGKLDTDFVARFLPDYEVSSVDGAKMVLVMTDQAISLFRISAIDQAIETIERRINAFGVAESTISKRGDTELVVQLPGVKEEDFAAAKEKLAQTGQLHFQMVDRTSAREEFYGKVGDAKPDPASWPEGLDESFKSHKVVTGADFARSTSRELLEYMTKGLVDSEHVIGFEQIFVDPNDANLRPINNLTAEQEKMLRKQKTDETQLGSASIVKAYNLYFMFRKAGMSGENVEDASVGYDQFNRPEVYMRFAQVDAEKFYNMTKEYEKELMAIMIDDVVYSAPRIKEPIPGGRVRIELGSAGNQALKEANALVAVLKSGALQAPLRKQYDSQVGPTLGADSVAAGKLSMIIGFVLVVIFMGVYYRVSGLVADVALFLNVLFVLAGLTAFGATLTLPGIAGIVLTVGMAVDANVLIFERIREELRLGKSVRAAIDAGYEKAFSAILDANVTTGIAAIVLYQFGSGPIRGFAVTLGIGIICSMYTALVVTRLIFGRLYGGQGEQSAMSI